VSGVELEQRHSETYRRGFGLGVELGVESKGDVGQRKGAGGEYVGRLNRKQQAGKVPLLDRIVA
jgi:hypothetical protein